MKNISLAGKSIIFGLVFHGLFFLLILFIPSGSVGSATTAEVNPFGINNPFEEDSKGLLPNTTSDLLKDLGVSWVSDSVFRHDVETKPLVYDWRSVDNKMKEYKNEAGLKIIFVINPVSDYEHQDGREHGKKYLPDGEKSLLAYEDYLNKLITRYKSKVNIWSVYNEPAGEYEDNIDDYVELVKRTYLIVKSVDPQAQVLLGGVGARQKLDFHKQVLEELRSACPNNGCFDLFDYHTYSWNYQSYNVTNIFKKTISDCQLLFAKTHQDYKNLLESVGFGDKFIINKEGGTHTGELKDPSQPYWCYPVQTESQQAEFLFKRAISQLANGIKIINWSTLGEKIQNSNDCDSRFAIIGLIYGGPDKCNQNDPYDAGKDVKKLSYYTYKFLIEKFKGIDFERIGVINAGVSNVYLYEFNKENGPVYVAWWDYFAEGENGETKTVTLSLPGIDTPQVKITQTIPNFPSDFQKNNNKLNEKYYPVFFESFFETFGPSNEMTISFGKKPIYIEEFRPLSIINPKNAAILKSNSTLKITVDPRDVGQIKNVDFLINDKRNCQDSSTDKEGYYTCAWKVPKNSNQSYKITARAYAFNKSELITQDSVEVIVE